MNTYVLQIYEYGSKKTVYEQMKASNLDNLRKNAIAKYYGKAVAIEVSQITGLSKTNFRGTLDLQPDIGINANWQVAYKNKWYMVDSSTGKLRRS